MYATDACQALEQLSWSLEVLCAVAMAIHRLCVEYDNLSSVCLCLFDNSYFYKMEDILQEIQRLPTHVKNFMQKRTEMSPPKAYCSSTQQFKHTVIWYERIYIMYKAITVPARIGHQLPTADTKNYVIDTFKREVSIWDNLDSLQSDYCFKSCCFNGIIGVIILSFL